ncbi:diguanylate cyclase [Thermotoga sp. KOL6]|uniref:sensor domain-containing diguanylate cyclase n=1 Tax=Thermotoga sp. KOL6 TaxID=126741 RepID=UPI000C77EBBE|nr:diguanylate cyclase [Thermotoga sp. KOL6]
MKLARWIILFLGIILIFLYNLLSGTPLQVNLDVRWGEILSRSIFLFAAFLLNILFAKIDMNVAFWGSFLLFLGAWEHFLEIFYLFPNWIDMLKILLYTAGSVFIFVEMFKILLKAKKLLIMFKGLFQENNDMVFFYTPEGKIVEVNPITERFLKYKKEELIGKNIEEIACQNSEDSSARTINLFQLKDAFFIPEKIFLSKDGEMLLCESKIIPLYEGKQLILIQEIARPIIERKKAEEQLKEERKKFLAYFNSLPILGIILNYDGTVASINETARSFLGIDVGANWFEKFPESFPQEILEKAFREKVVYEGNISTKKGERIVKWFFIPLKGQLLLAGIDITEETSNLRNLERDRKFYDLLLKISGNLLSLGWSNLVIKEYFPLISEVFEAESMAFYEKEDGILTLKIAYKGVFDSIISDVPKEIHFSHGILNIPLEYESDIFALFLIKYKAISKEIIEIAEIFKNQLELIYWKLKGEERILWLAEHDPLTQLYNRKAFESRLAYLINLSKRYGRKLSFVFIDLDNFKKVNDTMGHLIGDQVLKEFAKILSLQMRKSDIAGRLGGDEFGLVLPETDYNGAEKLMNRLQEILEKPLKVNGKEFKIDFSYGISMFPDDGENIEELLKTADERMYTNKFKKKGERRYVRQAKEIQDIHGKKEEDSSHRT